MRMSDLSSDVCSSDLGMLGQGRQGLTLTRGAGDTRVVQRGARCHRPEPLLACLGRFALAQQYRQRPAQGVAEAVLIVLRGPQAEQIGRATCRERVCPYVEVEEAAGSITKKKN